MHLSTLTQAKEGLKKKQFSALELTEAIYQRIDQFKLAHATDGKLTNLQAGLPLIVDGQIVGGIGVGSGTGEQDLVVAEAGIAAFEAG